MIARYRIRLMGNSPDFLGGKHEGIFEGSVIRELIGYPLDELVRTQIYHMVV